MTSRQSTQEEPAEGARIIPPLGPGPVGRSTSVAIKNSTASQKVEKREGIELSRDQAKMNYSNVPSDNPVGDKADYATHTAHQIAMNSSSTGPAVGDSVAEQLMQVYENMTQSSTPHDNAKTDGKMQYQVAVMPTSSKYTIPPPMFHLPSSRADPSSQSQQYESGAFHFEPPRHSNAPSKEDAIPPAVSVPSSIPIEGGESQESGGMANEESDEQSIQRSSRRKRRGSKDSGAASRGGGGSTGSSGKPKKKSKPDGRWSKRFTWPEDLHRDFVSAIFDVGLKQSSPSTILEYMPKHEQITTERIKSHLQKYRLHRAKSKKEFVSSYEASLRKLQSQGGVNGGTIAGGEIAAHLTYSEVENPEDGAVATEEASPTSAVGVTAESNSSQMNSIQDDPVPNGYVTSMSQPQQEHQEQNESLMLPELTEMEKQSPIGAAMGYLMGLFFSLRQQLLIQRSLEGSAQDTAQVSHSVQDVYSSFTNGHSTQGGAPVAVTIGSEYASDGMVHQQSIPSMRTNIEETSIMKREMQNQMALQNKMRALKEQELAKYKNIDSSQNDSRKSAATYSYGSDNDPYSTKTQNRMAGSDGAGHGQGAGEVAGHDVAETAQRPHGLSFGNSTEMWNADVVDEQLFEFLMND